MTELAAVGAWMRQPP